MARRNDELDLGPAVAGMLAAMGEAAGYAGGGMRTTGRRAGRVGAEASRRAWDGARRSGQRATVAYRVFRGAEPPWAARRRPLEFLGIAAVAGAIGAIAVLAVQRYRVRAAEAAAEESRADEPRTDETRADELRAGEPRAEGSAPDASVASIADRQEARTGARATARTTTR